MNAFATAVELEIEPLAGRIGAEIRSVDLARSRDAEFVTAISAALVEHKVVFVRDQFLDADAHVAFANRLGTPTMAHPTVPSLTGHPHVFELDAAVRRAGERVAHRCHVRRPTAARLDPQRGRHPAASAATRCGRTPRAPTTTSPSTCARSLTGSGSSTRTRADYGGMTSAGRSYTSAFHSTGFAARHPLVRVHPVSGRRSLLLGGFASRIEGVSAQESADLIRTFQTYVTRPENTVRWRYRAGDVVIWDNQATQHYAIDDYGDQPRRVQRVTLVGDAARSIDGRTSETVAGDPTAYLSLG